MKDKGVNTNGKKEYDIHRLFLSMPILWQEHGIRVAGAAARLFGMIVQDDLYEEERAAYTEQEVEQAVLYHDIGFLTVSKILSANHMLCGTKQKEIMRRHTVYGAGMIEQYRMGRCLLPREEAVWRLAAEVAASHHECWNGRGYPHGELATAISLISRITAIVNDYDRMLWEQGDDSLQKRMSALKKLKEGSGTRFDPRLMERFLEVCTAPTGFGTVFLTGDRRRDASDKEKGGTEEAI